MESAQKVRYSAENNKKRGKSWILLKIAGLGENREICCIRGIAISWRDRLVLPEVPCHHHTCSRWSPWPLHMHKCGSCRVMRPLSSPASCQQTFANKAWLTIEERGQSITTSGTYIRWYLVLVGDAAFPFSATMMKCHDQLQN